MVNKFLVTSCLTFIILTCAVQKSLGAAGWCYQCDSRTTGCQLEVNPVAMSGYKVPCSGQCYIRVKDGIMYRGCSWEHGFMTKQLTYTPIFEQQSMWIFCDTSLCNANANQPA